MKVHDLEVSVYLLEPEKPYLSPPATLERRGQLDGSVRWVVKRLSWVLSKTGDWEYEPQPSSRDDAFIERTRFASAQDALDAFLALTSEGE